MTSPAGQFRFFAAPGTWTLRALSRSGNGDAEITADRGVNEVAALRQRRLTDVRKRHASSALSAAEGAGLNPADGLSGWGGDRPCDRPARRPATPATGGPGRGGGS